MSVNATIRDGFYKALGMRAYAAWKEQGRGGETSLQGHLPATGPTNLQLCELLDEFAYGEDFIEGEDGG